MALNSADIPDPTRVTTKGTLTVTVSFDTGVKTGVTIDVIRDAMAKAVADVTGATDVTIRNGGAALILNKVSDS